MKFPNCQYTPTAPYGRPTGTAFNTCCLMDSFFLHILHLAIHPNEPTVHHCGRQHQPWDFFGSLPNSYDCLNNLLCCWSIFCCVNNTKFPANWCFCKTHIKLKSFNFKLIVETQQPIGLPCPSSYKMTKEQYGYTYNCSIQERSIQDSRQISNYLCQIKCIVITVR